MAGTRRTLECVPADKFEWKPHEKSFTLGDLANHLAGLAWAVELIIKLRGSRPPKAGTKSELLATFDKNVAAGREALSGVTEELFVTRMIPVTAVDRKLMREVLRGKLMNHLIHHRAQLSVYLRLLDVAVPGMYGPSADERSDP